MTAKERYREFLKSAFWQGISFECRYNANFICEKCHKGGPVHAHHKFYRPNWYDTNIEDLICLCEDCHNIEHGIDPFVAPKPNITRRMRIGKSRQRRFWKDHAKLFKKPKQTNLTLF